ncbi:hypothetical protein CPC08DRAFT_764936 [Agrocybe pediades]|nr:hypothetical protein CPC08DRAFT_764936 [Agrocybe pediades]
MTPTTATEQEAAAGSGFRARMRRAVEILCKQWLYIGVAIFLSTLNLLLGILTLSYLHPKKDALFFGIVCFGIISALGLFASLCYLIQRAKNEYSDPTLLDALYASGVVVLYALSGLALTIRLPDRCFSGHNEHFKVIGQGCCNGVTAMAVNSWLGVLMMIIASIIILVAARRAIEIAKQPPPVFPAGAHAPVMRWLDRNDPFLSVTERRQQYAV